MSRAAFRPSLSRLSVACDSSSRFGRASNRAGSLEAAEQVILDVNELAKGEKFMSIGAMAVSDDGKLLAYSTDNTGFRQYKLHVKDMGATIGTRMGLNTWAAFTGSEEQAEIAGDVAMLDFTQKKRCMQAGIEAAQKGMPEIKKKIEAWEKKMTVKQ